MSDEVLNDSGGTVLDINIPPVDPRVVRLERGCQEVVARPAHGLATRPLSFESMSVLNVLAELEAKVLLDNEGTPELVGALLKTIELGGEDGKGFVSGIANKEGEVDQVMGVCELGDQLKVLGQVSCGILEGREDKDSLLIVDGVCGGLDGVQVDVFDG